ncbi:MAG: DUF1553 domain-containing protein, partial [Verrucomicrobiales bacterium]|nr:DUF1553 domain-containing protein [Verrucomicrobiales bacterium]
VIAEDRIDFNRQIRPILSENCYFCHGPDAAERKADMRLDQPGGLDGEELKRRIHETDRSEIMPPPKSKLSLTEAEKKLLAQWIDEGAEYSQHWSFVAPDRPELPELPANLKSWPKNGIDHFIAARLAREKLEPSPEAIRERLIRRVTLDLTGLPPTPEEVDAFLADKSENAYEKVVNRLLGSPRYGERMALPWLDAARYADTGGYQGDIKKTQWPWRDWVIDAYNSNKAFDQFTIEQIAGDLLPNPTDEQRLATAFNRNHRINDEGGIIAEEFRVEYVADRVETTSTVWLGLTVGCARCHDHKYDPITQRDFYELYAFFNNIPENGKDGALAPKPNMEVYTGGTKEEHAALEKRAAELAEQQKGYTKQHAAAFQKWAKETAAGIRAKPEFAELPSPIVHLPLDQFQRTQTTNLIGKSQPAVTRGNRNRVQPNKPVKHGNGAYLLQGGFLDLRKPVPYSSSDSRTWAAWVKPTRDVAGLEGPVFSRVTPDDKRTGYLVSLVAKNDQEFQVSFRLQSDKTGTANLEVMSTGTVKRNALAHIAVAYDGSGKAAGVRIFIDGKPVGTTVSRDALSGKIELNEEILSGAETEDSSAKTIRDELLANTFIDDLRIYPSALTESQIGSIFALTPTEILAAAPDRGPRETQFLSAAYFRDHDPAYKKLVAESNKANAALKAFEASKITSVAIMEEMPAPRETFLLHRGVYDQPDKSTKLQPAVLSALPPMPESLPNNRLGLAKWILADENPLTARVAVNRYWQMIIGTGLVKTPEDFGSQGQAPTHPELLDWLAVEFRESGWDVKAMLKTIVTSATYRQRSAISSDLRERDPNNKLLARGPRFRLYGQALRDQALAMSGRLDTRIGGPPVMPYQPAGLWEEVSAKGVKYVVADGPDLYRRSLYTFWRRTVPPPSMMNFDNASREICSVNATRTNTPLQAMNLMNDPQYVEAARFIAARMIREGGQTPAERIRHGHKIALAREPGERVLKILLSGYEDYLAHFNSDAEAATGLVSVGKTAPEKDLDPAELAALTAVASVILNLDETVTKE